MRDVHLVYPHADRISCPDAIGRHLANHLRARYRVHLHDWDERGAIIPKAGAVLLGHPHPSPLSIFRRSLDRDGWGRRLILAPYNHGDLRQSAWLDPLIPRCDLYLALTGDHWYRSVPDSSFRHWAPKMVQMDLAVDRNEFPPIKRTFNALGRRRFLFIGHSTWTKNVGFLGEVARLASSGSISWMGTGPAIPGVEALGLTDFRTEAGKALVAAHDFVISVGRADANPASVLEGMAWGLIPVCSRESAHAELPGIAIIPTDRASEAARVLAELQGRGEEDLLRMQSANWSALDERFTWSRFARRVVDAIESSRSPRLERPPSLDRLRIARARLASPYGWWRPSEIVKQARGFVRTVSG